MKALLLGFGAAALFATCELRAAGDPSNRAAELPEPTHGESTAAVRGEPARLPRHLQDDPTNYWLIGLTTELVGTGPNEHDGLYGITVQHRLGAFAPHVLTQLKPSAEGFEQFRQLFGLGLRSYFPVLGVELSYGVGAHFEARLADHFWLAYATPVELGAVLYSHNSFSVQLFVGARSAFAGHLINHFLLDPNGFDDERAQERLEHVRFEQPWRGFLRLVVGRRVD
jgi:hypothetical protein